MPFTELQFFKVFQRYNDAVRPAQLLLYGLAVVALILATCGDLVKNRYVQGWIIPVLWGLIATQVAVHFGVYEDFGLTLAALAAVAFVLADRRSRYVVGTSGAV